MLGFIGPLGKTSLFRLPWDWMKFQKILIFLYVFKLPFSKPFWNGLNYVSTPNIWEVMNVCNLGDQSFETIFNALT